MNTSSFRVLELDKIKDMLSSRVYSCYGREFIENWLPFTELSSIQERSEQITQLKTLILKEENLPLGGLSPVRHLLEKAEKAGILSPQEILPIGEVLKTSRLLLNFFQQKIEQKSSLWLKLNQIRLFPSLEKRIFKSFDSNFEFLDTASVNLREIRRKMKSLHFQIMERLKNILQAPTHQRMIQDSIITTRHERYVIPIRQEFSSQFPGIVHAQSASGATIFMEPSELISMNNKLAQLKLEETREKERILAELSSIIGEVSKALQTNLDIIGFIDAIWASARFSFDFTCRNVKFNNNGYLYIKEARHPLLGERAVPIDIYIGKDFHTLVITGPNTGGKTVSLKTVGLFALMAQMGLHLPVEEAEMSLFHDIFADIGDEQSILQNLSTFSAHVNNILSILPHAGPRSLILLDELGAGTDPSEGSALGMTFLEHFHRLGARTIATTHFNELKIYAGTREGMANASVEFNLDTLSPTYKVSIGKPGRSMAITIAERLGLPPELIKKARGFMKEKSRRLENIIQKFEEEEKMLKEERKKLEILKAELDLLKGELNNQIQNLEAIKKQTVKEAYRKAYREAKEIVTQTINEIQQLKEAETEKKVITEQLEDKEEELSRKIESLEEKKPEEEKITYPPLSPDEVKQGLKVWVSSLKQSGYIISELKDGVVQVQVGIIRLKLPIEEIRKLPHHLTFYSSKAETISIKKEEAPPNKLYLKGMTVDEALYRLEKYLDTISLTSYQYVSIIHGKGQGILRKAVHQYLKKHPLVKTFRLGEISEGGTGVTIAIFN